MTLCVYIIMAMFKAGFSLLNCCCPSVLGFSVVGGIVNLVLKAVRILCEHTVCPIDLQMCVEQTAPWTQWRETDACTCYETHKGE